MRQRQTLRRKKHFRRSVPGCMSSTHTFGWQDAGILPASSLEVIGPKPKPKGHACLSRKCALSYSPTGRIRRLSRPEKDEGDPQDADKNAESEPLQALFTMEESGPHRTRRHPLRAGLGLRQNRTCGSNSQANCASIRCAPGMGATKLRPCVGSRQPKNAPARAHGPGRGTHVVRITRRVARSSTPR